MMHERSGHLPYTTLADLAEGRLTPNAQIQAHLDSCAACSAELAWLERAIRLMRDSQEPPSPPEGVAKAKRLFLQRRGTRAAQPLQHVIAALRFDSARGAPAFSMRGVRKVERQLLYRSGAYDFELQIDRSGKLWVVSGQVFSTANTEQESPVMLNGTVELLGPEGSSQTTLSDESEFVLQAVKAGVYMLTLQIGDLVVAFPNLEIGI